MLGSLWIMMILCTHWEPIVRDGWSNVFWHRWNKFDLPAVWHLFKDGWLGSNPRLGQTLTTVLYVKGPYHSIVTPLLELGLLGTMTAMILGRWPKLRRTDDALSFAIFAICTPQFGPMLFYRPFFGNYTFGLLLNLLWLVPFRFHVAEPRRWAWWWMPLMLVLGTAAGMCNEHTGLPVLALGVGAVVWSLRKKAGVPPWMITGLLGLAAGYVILMIAPGHDARYNGLAKEAGMLGRVLDRGLGGNLRIVGILGLHLLWSLPWVGLALVARRRAKPTLMPLVERGVLAALAIAGVLATLALLASPRIGPRLYVPSIALISMGITGAVIAQLAAPWARKLCGVMSIAVLIFVEIRCVMIYRAVGAVSAERQEIITTAAPNTSVVVPRYPYGASKWFVGEDFTAENLRVATAADHGLKEVYLAPE